MSNPDRNEAQGSLRERLYADEAMIGSPAGTSGVVATPGQDVSRPPALTTLRPTTASESTGWPLGTLTPDEVAALDVDAPLDDWTLVGDDWQSWEAPGDAIFGTKQDDRVTTYQGSQRRVGTVLAPDGPVSFPLPVTLAERWDRVPWATPVHITFTGVEDIGGGKVVKLFAVRTPPQRKQ